MFLVFVLLRYEASGGTEYFISSESPEEVSFGERDMSKLCGLRNRADVRK